MRFSFPDLARPPTRLTDVVTRLLDFALITYAVDPERLAPYLAPGFQPHVRTFDDGSRRALISAVPFRDRDFRFNLCPWARFAMGQTNYRAYVLYQGRPCVWFFGTSLTRPYVYGPILWWRLPWYPARMAFDTRWDGDLCLRYRLQADSLWAPMEVELEGTSMPMGRLDGFDDEEQAAVVLTHPVIGYYYRRDGRVGTYSIWHDRLRMRQGRARRARIDLFERLGLIEAGAEPHSVLLQRESEFIIHLPPRALPGT